MYWSIWPQNTNCTEKWRSCWELSCLLWSVIRNVNRLQQGNHCIFIELRTPNLLCKGKIYQRDKQAICPHPTTLLCREHFGPIVCIMWRYSEYQLWLWAIERFVFFHHSLKSTVQITVPWRCSLFWCYSRKTHWHCAKKKYELTSTKKHTPSREKKKKSSPEMASVYIILRQKYGHHSLFKKNSPTSWTQLSKLSHPEWLSHIQHPPSS